MKLCPKIAGLLLAWLTLCRPVLANIPGGGTGTGPNVTLSDNGNTVTVANGIISILCTKSGATIDQINYTFNNGGGTQTLNLLSGGNNGGQLYWELGGFGGGTFVYSVVADPANNGGNYAEIRLLSSSASSGTMEAHFSMLRGSTGFYVTPIWSHRSIDAAVSMGETRDNIYAGSIFNWMSVDATRDRLMQVSGGSATGVLGAPAEVSLWTSGLYQGQYEDKYKYTADFGELRVWGWSSVGTGGKNVGLWNVSASVEYYNGGPMKRELMEHIGTTILNVTRGSHYGGGTDSSWAAAEVWTHVFGPYFIYCNNITNTITGTNQPAQALYADALAQAAAEETAWPYSWFTNVPDYSPASNRGTVTGQILISDAYNPNASESNLWVGLVQQPLSTTAICDFQKWQKPYQFWTRTASNGNFVLPDVIAGTNYTLYAFGPGAAGTFQSQAQSGGSAPNSVDIPASPFSVTVAGSSTNNLGLVTWTPTRVGPTVFEIGYPDRTARKFRHGEDWWVGDIGPNPTNPSPVWSKFLEYPFDFPNGPNYFVGQSRWSTDWNFVQPIVTDAAGNYNGSTSTITFNLGSPPGATASLYLALSSDYQGPLIIQVNGNNIAGSSGYFPAYSSSSDESDTTIREGIHGMFSDNRITFSGSLLQQGQNTITINMRKGGYFANHAMYDYIRLELTGYVPPAPASVVAYPGNHCNLVSWPVTPGATSYNVLRSTTFGSGYAFITNGIVGPVCGSGWNNATFLDQTAANGATYFYVIQSANPVDASTNSPQSTSSTPSGSFLSTPPATPTGLAVGSSGHQSVTLNWSPSSGANFYTVYRSTLFNNGGGASNLLGTIVLANNVTTTSYTDTSPTDGTIYSYVVAATGTGGTSSNSSSPAVAVPLPAPPAGAPASLSASFIQTTNVLLTWPPVTGAVGYVIRRATSPAGPFTFLMSVTETNYLDVGLDITVTYYYQVAAVNAAGVSPNSSASATAPPLAPMSLSAIPGNAQITLSWPPVPNANSYVLTRGTSSKNEDTVVISGYTGTSYTNTGLLNGITYYYIVTGSNSAGLGPDSPEASATPSASIVVTPRSLTWRGDGSANIWDVSGAGNWQTSNVATIFNNGDSATFDNTGSNSPAISLSGALQPSLVSFNASKAYTLGGAGSLVGTNALVKSGTGTLTITATNSYSGGTVLSNGATIAGSASANNVAFGAGPITFDGGTLEFNGWTGSTTPEYGGNTNSLIVSSGQTGTVHVPQRFTSPGLAGGLSGSGTLNLMVKFVRGDISGNWSAFTGKINVSNGSGGSTVDDFRVANANGFPVARLNLTANVFMYSRATPNSVIPIGEFSAAFGSTVTAGGGTSAGVQNAVTWRVGGLNTDATNSTSFQGTVALIKEGAGTWTLTGASSHTGSTVVSNGTLLVNGSFSGSPITVYGGLLGGIGVISGTNVTINPGGSLAPGNPLGTLTIGNNLTLSAGSTTFMRVQHSPLTNNAVTMSGSLTENGTLNVTNFGGSSFIAGDHFQLFNAASYNGSFANYVLPPLSTGQRWNTSRLNVDGSLWVLSTASPLITQTLAAGTSLSVSGTGGTPNWTYYVLATTNLTVPTSQWVRIATNSFDSSGSFVFTNSMNLAISRLFLGIQAQ